jgi:hypothetical protein
MRRCAAFLSFVLALAAAPLAGQSQVTGIRDLAFGIVIRGVQTSVSPNDPVRSGRFYVRHVLNRPVQLRFTLPTQLARVGGGGNLPISFSNTDAVAQGTAPSSVPVVFNPNNPQTFILRTSADFYVNLGGRVSPAANQASGNYRGTVVLACNFF